MTDLRALRPVLPILVGVALMLTLSMGLRQSLGLFLQPLTRDVSISVSDFTLAIAVQNLAWGFLQPVAGALTVRWGFRPLMLGGAVLYVAGLLLLATAQGMIGVMLGAGVLIGMSLACTAAAIAMSVAARAVPVALRSLVLGIVSAAGSVGALLTAPLGQILSEGFGWRTGVLAFAVLAIAMLPAAWFAGRVDAVALPAPAENEIGDTSARSALRSALHSAPFLVMAGAYFVCGMQLIFITTHLPSYLAICGMDPMLSAETLGVIGGFNVLGSLFFGWAGGRWNKLALLGTIYISRSIVLGLYFAVSAHTDGNADLCRLHGLPVAGRRSAGRRRGRRDVRAALASHDPGPRLRDPPDRKLRRRIWWRRVVRCTGLLHPRLADRGRGGAGGGDRADRLRAGPADPTTPARNGLILSSLVLTDRK
jgi:predicted MFS family arabinose efflux permease